MTKKKKEGKKEYIVVDLEGENIYKNLTKEELIQTLEKIKQEYILDADSDKKTIDRLNQELKKESILVIKGKVIKVIVDQQPLTVIEFA